MMQITRIRGQRRARDRLEIRLGDIQLVLAAEVVLRAGLQVGQELSPEELGELERADLAWRCKDTALRLLGHRPRSVRQLRQRLLMRKMPAPVVDACVSELVQAGLLDDAVYARALVRERMRLKPSGRARLAAELRALGVDAEVSETVLSEAFAGQAGDAGAAGGEVFEGGGAAVARGAGSAGGRGLGSARTRVGGESDGVSAAEIELELARKAAAKFRRRSGEEAMRARRRLYAHLLRRGFPADICGQVVEEVGGSWDSHRGDE